MNTEHPDPAARPQKRRFSNEYKLRILTEYEAQPDSGARGSLLRREGLYTSHIVDWRKARDAGKLIEGQTSSAPAASLKELERLRKRNLRLEEQVTKCKLALEIQGKHPSSWRGCWPRATRRRGSSRDRPGLRAA